MTGKMNDERYLQLTADGLIWFNNIDDTPDALVPSVTKYWLVEAHEAWHIAKAGDVITDDGTGRGPLIATMCTAIPLAKVRAIMHFDDLYAEIDLMQRTLCGGCVGLHDLRPAIDVQVRLVMLVDVGRFAHQTRSTVYYQLGWLDGELKPLTVTMYSHWLPQAKRELAAELANQLKVEPFDPAEVHFDRYIK